MKRRYFKELRFRQIRALVELKRRGAFAEVARHLQLSVPSVWQQIRALEDEFDVRLAVARGNKVELTDDGHLLAELSIPVVDSFEYLRHAFAERQKGLQRKLILATTTSLLTYDLPPVIAAYRKVHPDIQITFLEQSPTQARETFEQGHADLAVIGDRALAEPGRQYRAETVTAYDTHLDCPAGHALMKAKRLTLARIARHPLILPVEGDLRDIAIGTFNEAKLNDITISMSANSINLIDSFVQMGYGVGLATLSPVTISRGIEFGAQSLHLRNVSKLFGKESIVMVSRAIGHEHDHVRAFRETVIRVMKQRLS